MSADVDALIAEAVADFRRALPSRVARIAALVNDPVGLRAEAHALSSFGTLGYTLSFPTADEPFGDEAVEAREELRWMLIAAQARIEVWRSQEASNRAEGKATI